MSETPGARDLLTPRSTREWFKMAAVLLAIATGICTVAFSAWTPSQWYFWIAPFVLVTASFGLIVRRGWLLRIGRSGEWTSSDKLLLLAHQGGGLGALVALFFARR